jgi:chromosome segregation ATPase
MKRNLESTQKVLKEAQDANKAADFKQEFLENLIKKWESDMDEARTQLDTQCKDLECTRGLLKKAQEAKEQADLKQEFLVNDNKVLVAELQKLSIDRRSQQEELVRSHEAHLLKDATTQKVLGKTQAAMKLLEIDKYSLEKITKKLELKLEAVREDRDSKENKLVDLQRLLEQAKSVADSTEASMCTAHKKWGETRDQLKTKGELLVVAYEELTRLRTKLEESTKVDANESEQLKKKLDDSEKRSHRVTDLLSNTMDELITERRSRRVLEKQIEDVEANSASEMALKKSAESQVERIGAQLAARASVPAVNIVKKEVKDECDVRIEAATPEASTQRSPSLDQDSPFLILGY